MATIDNATNITARINVMEAVPNVDINYGPYASKDDAIATLRSVEAICQGLTVSILENGLTEEYWFKEAVNPSTMDDETLKTKLIKKLGVDSYDVLDGKPSINGHELASGENSLETLGIASSLDFNEHTENAKIHTPIEYVSGETALPINNITIEEDKMTITVGGNEYSFRLTEWHDISDFYVLFLKIIYNNGNYYVDVNGNYVLYNNLTGSQLRSFAYKENGTLATNNDWFYVKKQQDKEELVLSGETVYCDYIIHNDYIPQNTNAVVIMYRTSGNKPVSLDKFLYIEGLGGDYDYIYNPPTNNMSQFLNRSGVVYNDADYSLAGYYDSTVVSFGVGYAINFTNN